MATRHSYVRFFPSDWKGGTARMAPMIRLVYFEVCLHNWDKAEAMPRTEQALVLSDVPKWKEHIDALVAAGKLRRTRGGAIYSERALNEARSSHELASNLSAAGSTGAAKRWGNKRKSDSPPIATPIANQNQNQNHITPPTPPRGDESELFELAPEEDIDATRFEAWWREYPNKTGKGAAQKAFAKALEKLSGSPNSKAAQLVFSLRAQLRVWRRKGVEGRFIPHAATWLNQSRWTDDEVVAEATRKIRPEPPPVELSPADPVPSDEQRDTVLPRPGWVPGDA
jgi:hypothetical protein